MSTWREYSASADGREEYLKWDEYMELFKGVQFTFSRNCSSGLGHCDCHRCRNGRGEPVDTVIEMHAATVSEERQSKGRTAMFLQARRAK